MPVSEIQKQLRKFETAGIRVSRIVGTSRNYTWNPRDPALGNPRALLRDTLDSGISTETLKKYFCQRRRPRRADKFL